MLDQCAPALTRDTANPIPMLAAGHVFLTRPIDASAFETTPLATGSQPSG